MLPIEFRDSGINLFASAKVQNIDPIFHQFLNSQKIKINPDDVICLIASGGRELWKHLNHPLEIANNPIEKYSIELINKFDPNAVILFPNDQFHFPLQKLGRALNLSTASPLGLDLNADYGAWFAFRGAFLTNKKVDLSMPPAALSPCESCSEKPCIKTCPAEAIKHNSPFNVNKCSEYRFIKKSMCGDVCLARLSCPYKKEHQYSEEQINYHMSSNPALIKLHNIKS